MKRYRAFLRGLFLSAVFITAGCTTHGPGETDQNTQALNPHGFQKTLLAAVGASVTYGIGSEEDEGFLKPFRNYLRRELDTGPGRRANVFLYNAAVPGATSGEVVENQLGDVLYRIPYYNHGTVAFVGSDGGGNDIRAFMNSPDFAYCMQPDLTQCVMTLFFILADFEMNFEIAVSSIRSAIGPDAPLFVNTQYNPMHRAVCDPTGGQIAALGDGVFEGIPFTPLERGFNVRVREIAHKYNAVVVETFLPFAMNPENFIHDDCIHPSDAGYDVILDALIDAFEENY